MSASALGLIELLLVFGLVIGVAVWQWLDWRKWKRGQNKPSDQKSD